MAGNARPVEKSWSVHVHVMAGRPREGFGRPRGATRRFGEETLRPSRPFAPPGSTTSVPGLLGVRITARRHGLCRAAAGPRTPLSSFGRNRGPVTQRDPKTHVTPTSLRSPAWPNEHDRRITTAASGPRNCPACGGRWALRWKPTAVTTVIAPAEETPPHDRPHDRSRRAGAAGVRHLGAALGPDLELLAGRQGQLRGGRGGRRRLQRRVPRHRDHRPQQPRLPAPQHPPSGRRGGHPAVPGRRDGAADRGQHPRGRPGNRAGVQDRLRRQRPDDPRARPRPAPLHPAGGDLVRGRQSVRARPHPGGRRRDAGPHPSDRPHPQRHPGARPGLRRGTLHRPAPAGRPALRQLSVRQRRLPGDRPGLRASPGRLQRDRRGPVLPAAGGADRGVLRRPGTRGAGRRLRTAVASGGIRADAPAPAPIGQHGGLARKP